MHDARTTVTRHDERAQRSSPLHLGRSLVLGVGCVHVTDANGLQPRVLSFLADAVLSWDAAIRFARDAHASVRACGVWSDPSRIEASFRATTWLGSHRDKSVRVRMDISQVHHYMTCNGRFTRTARRSEF